MAMHGKYLAGMCLAALILCAVVRSSPAQSTGSGVGEAPRQGIQSADCGAVLFSDDFNDGNADGWISSGDGTWYVDNYEYVVDMGEGYDLKGISLNGDPSWTNYVFEMDMGADVGADKAYLFRYIDDENTYGADVVGIGAEFSFANLVKVEAGAAQTLVTVNYEHDLLAWHHVVTIVQGNRIIVTVDGDLLFDYTDEGSTLTHGQIGLQGWTGGWGSDSVRYDNITVRSLCQVFLPAVIR